MLNGLDAYLTTQPADEQNALATAPDYCDCGAELTDDDGKLCLVCEERIDLGRLDGPDDEGEEL